MEEESDPEEAQEQQEGTLEQMETNEWEAPDAPIKGGMGINIAPENYQPAPPRYIRAGEDSQNEEDGPDEEEDLEAPYLAPRPAPSPSTVQDKEQVQTMKSGQTPTKDPSELSGEESIPELIDLGEKEEIPLPLPLQKAQCSALLRLPIIPFPPPEGLRKIAPEAACKVIQEKVPEEPIIHIDDDADPSPLQLLERQVDSLLMPPQWTPPP